MHIGSPKALGISDLDKPDWGERVDFEDGDVPVFWACGVTPQQVGMEAKTDLMITHSTGHMFVTSMRIEGNDQG